MRFAYFDSRSEASSFSRHAGQNVWIGIFYSTEKKWAQDWGSNFDIFWKEGEPTGTLGFVETLGNGRYGNVGDHDAARRIGCVMSKCWWE